jgi:hypothetical protein
VRRSFLLQHRFAFLEGLLTNPFDHINRIFRIGLSVPATNLVVKLMGNHERVPIRSPCAVLFLEFNFQPPPTVTVPCKPCLQIYPLDVASTRVTADIGNHSTRQFRNIQDVLYSIYRKEGARVSALLKKVHLCRVHCPNRVLSSTTAILRYVKRNGAKVSDRPSNNWPSFLSRILLSIRREGA